MNQSELNDVVLNLVQTYSEALKGYDNVLGQVYGNGRHEDNDEHDHDHDHEHEHDDSNDYDLIVAKATAMVVLFIASTICGTIPFLLNKWFKWTDTGTSARSAIVVKCLLYFGGGVLLCTTFLHLLPEVQENIEGLQNDQFLPQLGFHLAEFLTCIGFFAMFLVEEVIHMYLHRQKKNASNAQQAFQRGHSVRHSFLVSGSMKGRKRESPALQESGKTSTDTIPQTSTVEPITGGTPESTEITHVKGFNGSNSTIVTMDSGLCVTDLIHKNQSDHQSDQIQRPIKYNGTAGSMDHNSNNKNDNHYQHHHHHHSHHHHNPAAAGAAHSHSHGHGHSHGIGHSHIPVTGSGSGAGNNSTTDEDLIVSSLRGLLVVLALSLHELFEGLAVGLEGSASQVWYMFGAVSAHKLVLAFCVGVELIVTRTRLWLAITYVITFAIVSPIGIGTGILVSHGDSGAASAIPSAILQGLATGTLLYVVFFEILSKERSGLIAYSAFIIGFFVMFGLQFATGHEHTHSHSHGNGNIGHDHGNSSEDGHNNDTTETDHKSLHEKLKLLRETSEEIVNALVKKKV